MWTEHILNPKTITSIFRDEPPSFLNIQLHDLVIISGEDLQCRIRFDLEEFLVDPPKKWVDQRFNTIQFTITLVQTKIIQCTIPSSKGIGDLIILFQGKYFDIQLLIDRKIVFEAVATWCQIDKISAYLREKE